MFMIQLKTKKTAQRKQLKKKQEYAYKEKYYLLNLSINPKYLTKIIIRNGWVQIKCNQGTLIEILVWWIVLVE